MKKYLKAFMDYEDNLFWDENIDNRTTRIDMWLKSDVCKALNLAFVSGSLPNLIDLSNVVERAIIEADASTSNWYAELQKHLQKEGYTIIKRQ